MRNKI